jgi:uncharacterized NAD(P)/FAD-binding protein YdhS
MRLAIIGGGFSGISLSYHLFHLLSRTRINNLLELYLIEKELFAQGPAYCTKSPSHILNVPAIAMSALYGEPHHFLAYAQSKDPSIKGSSFASRTFFAQYLRDILNQLKTKSNPQFFFHKLHREVVNIKRFNQAVLLYFKDGSTLEVDKAVIATGNYPPAPFSLIKGDIRYQNDPWDKSYPHLDNSSESICLIGTGLTMVDKVLELKDLNYKGTIYAISRRGLLPQPQNHDVNCFEFDYEVDPLIPEYSNPYFDFKAYALPHEIPSTVLGVYRLLKSEIKRANALGIDQSCVFNAFLLRFIDFWYVADKKEQRKFIKYLRPYWNIYAHKIPLSSYETVLSMIKEGVLVIKHGDVKTIEFKQKHALVNYKTKTNDMYKLQVSRVINCSGPAVKPKDIEDKFLENLLSQGIIKTDSWGLLAATDELGRPIINEGETHDDIFILGSFKKGPLAATQPVPFIRLKAMNLAIKILQDAGSDISDDLPQESLCELS